MKYCASVLLSMGLMWGTALAVTALPAKAESVPTDTWPMYQGRSDHEAVFDAPWWNVRWHATFGGHVNGGISIVGTTLYVEAFDNRLYALDALTGRERWHANVRNTPMNTPIVADGRVFVGTGESNPRADSFARFVIGQAGGDSMYAFDASSGKQLWRVDTPGENMPTAVYTIAHGRHELVFSNGDDAVRALDPATGDVLWKTPMVGASTMSSLALYKGLVYGLSLNGFRYYEKAEKDPTLLAYVSRSWSIRPDGQYIWQSPYGNADCSPAVGDGMVFVEGDVRLAPIESSDSTSYNTVHALDAKSGKLLWTYRSASGPVSLKGSKEASVAGLYVRSSFFESLPFPAQFVSLDGRTGKLLWSIQAHAAIKMSAVERGGRLYFGDTAGWFYVVDANSGAVLQSVHFPAIFTASPPIIVGDTIFVANDRTLYAVPIAENGLIEPIVSS